MPRLVSRADLARRAKVSRPALTKQCKKALAPACDGDRIDLDHPAVQSFLKAHGVEDKPPPVVSARAPTKTPKRAAWVPDEQTEVHDPPPKRRRKPTRAEIEAEPLPPQPDGAGSSEDLDELVRYLQPLRARFGTERLFRDWLIGLKIAEDIDSKRLDTAIKRGAVYPRQFVHAHILGLINGFNLRLLGDTPKTLCRELYSLAKTGRPLEEAERISRQLLGKQLKSVKSRVEIAIQNAGLTSDNPGRPGQPGGSGSGADDGDGPSDTKRVGRKS